MSKWQSTPGSCATTELSKLESALPLTKSPQESQSILKMQIPALLLQLPVQESQGPQALESKVKAARVQEIRKTLHWPGQNFYRPWCERASVVSSLRGGSKIGNGNG